MRMWGYTATPEELVAVTRAQDAFRQLWTSIRPPWPAAFDGTVTDVRAIDYLDYEGLALPPCGIEGAALVCGEVLRRAARLEWAVSYRGEWLVTTPEHDWPSIAICPLARLHELECGAGPQDGKYNWFLDQAALECLPLVDPEAEPDVRQLLGGNAGYSGNGEYVRHVELAIRRLRKHDGSA